MAKNKYYVVTSGRKLGIFDNNELAREQVICYKGGVLKGFETLLQAQECAVWYGLSPNVVWTVYGKSLQKFEGKTQESSPDITQEYFSKWIQDGDNLQKVKKFLAEIDLKKKQEKERKLQQEREKELKKKSKIKPIRYVLSESFEVKKGTPLQIYCDASCVFEKDKAGIGFVVMQDGKYVAEYSEEVECNYAISYLEAYAILRAIEYAEKHHCKDLKIFSDSRDALNYLNYQISKDNHPVINKLIQKCQKFSEKGYIQFQKVKAHVGIIGNENADKLAKISYKLPTTDQHNHCCAISSLK